MLQKDFNVYHQEKTVYITVVCRDTEKEHLFNQRQENEAQRVSRWS